MCRWISVATAIFAATLTGLNSTAQETVSEEEAIKALRGKTTNIQFHKDGDVRLVRFSKQIVTDDALQHLSAFSRIEYLAVVCPQVTDEGLGPIAERTTLQSLMLAECGITDTGLQRLKPLENLQRLYLQDTSIGDRGLEHLAGLSRLQKLSLARTRVTGEGLEKLRRFGNLEFLVLDGTDIGDEGLEHLAALPNLRILYLSNCGIQGPGLEQLQKLSHLEHLALNGNDIDAAALSPLTELESLKCVELKGTRVGLDDLLKLQSTMATTVFAIGSVPQASFPTELAAKPQTTSDHAEILAPIASRLTSGEDIPAPDFARHVIPLLGRLGCNGRACHGSFQGQGGFRLSMFGYDFDADLANLIDRVEPGDPDESLLLNKPTWKDEHGGGLRLVPGSWQQDLLRRWIVGGAAGVGADSPQFVRLDVTPNEIVFPAPGESTELRVVAVWSNGTREDVTCLTRFETKDETVAEVSADGHVRATGKGDTHIISFYDNGIHCTPIVVPVSKYVGDRFPEVPTPTRIDELVTSKLRKLGVVPSELCSDETFLRRVSLDLIGTLPTPDEIREFVADEDPQKRTKKIDELLERPAYVTWWTTRMCDLTGSNAGYLGGTEMAQPVAAQWRAWIERRVQDNVGWDKIVEGIVLARSRRTGQTYADFVAEQSEFTRRQSPADYGAAGNPMPHFWFRDNIKMPAEKALAFGYTFLGIRLQCAQCHKHPYDQWSKRDFEMFSEFFSRIRAGTAPDALPLYEEMRDMLAVPEILNTAALRRQSYLRIAAEGRPIPWKEIYITPPKQTPQMVKLLGGAEFDASSFSDPREPLMQWLVTEPNRYLAKAFVNRIWANYFNVGIVDPPDDLNLANPPSNGPLLEYLATGFIQNGYDLKWLHRTITNSRTYQLSWRPNDTNRIDQRNFSHAIVRRLPAEVAVDAIIQATANDGKMKSLVTNMTGRKIGQHPRSYQTRSIDYSLLILGKPLRTTNCDCERQNEPTLLQSLFFRNDHEVLGMFDRSDGWLVQLSRSKNPPEKLDEMIQTAYLRTFSRLPSQQEVDDCRQHVLESEDMNDGLRDMMWALINSQEFITNH